MYEGVHELIGKKLAIKCMHLDFAADGEAVARFKREARAATAVGNEHIVDVSDIGDLPDGSPFMVMEYLDGRELAALIEQESPVAISRIIGIALQVLEALAEAHSSGVVHRDMKPENIFLVQRGGNIDFVKVLDFGISMISEHADAAQGRMTQTGIAMGTPNYMSPEQAMGKRVDLRTDLYSVGVILYQALTNTMPFQASSLAVLMTKILTEVPGSMLDHRSDLPLALDRIVQRAMAKEPDIRFEDAEEFADALRPFLDPAYVPPAITPAVADEPIGNATVALTKPRSKAATVPGGDETAELPFRSDGQPAAGAALGDETLLAADTERGRSRALLFAGVGASAALAIGVFLMMGGSDKKEPAKAAVVTPVAVVPVIADARPQIVREVSVTISTVPAGAKVYLDGKPFPNSSQVAQQRSLAPVRVQVVLAGYQAIDDVVVFDKDRELVFELMKSEVGKSLQPTSKDGKKKRPKNKHQTKEPTVASPVDEKHTDEKKNKDPSVYSGSQGTVRDEF